MKLLKVLKDRVAKFLLGTSSVPSGLFELNRYFRQFQPIVFNKHREGGIIIAISTNFQYGSIIAHGKDEKELDANIKDAILTAFELPSAYKKEAAISLN